MNLDIIREGNKFTRRIHLLQSISFLSILLPYTKNKMNSYIDNFIAYCEGCNLLLKKLRLNVHSNPYRLLIDLKKVILDIEEIKSDLSKDTKVFKQVNNKLNHLIITLHEIENYLNKHIRKSLSANDSIVFGKIIKLYNSKEE